MEKFSHIGTCDNFENGIENFIIKEIKKIKFNGELPIL